jgi:hypothetical protein
MKKTFLIACALLIAATAFAADTTVTGILMDKSCAKGDMGKQDPKTHDKGCNLMPDCVKSGYGVVTDDGKYLTFDAAGNKQATAWLKATKEKTNLKVTVTGAVEKDTIKVTSIK